MADETQTGGLSQLLGFPLLLSYFPRRRYDTWSFVSNLSHSPIRLLFRSYLLSSDITLLYSSILNWPPHRMHRNG
jgi:hypothetical protein